MSTLEEHVDVAAPIDATWDCLHHWEDYPHFVDGVRDAHSGSGGRTHLDVETGRQERSFDAEVSDDERRNVMSWHTADDAPDLAGALALSPIDRNHTRVQARLEYDSEAIRRDFGGPKGFAQANAIERVVHSDLEHFKEYVEQGR